MKAFPNSRTIDPTEEYITTIGGIDLYWDPELEWIVAIVGDKMESWSRISRSNPDFDDDVPPDHPVRDFAKTYLNMIS